MDDRHCTPDDNRNCRGLLIHFQPIPPTWVNAAWGDCEPLLKPSFRRKLESYDLDDAKEKCLAGRWQLWAAHDEKKIIGAIFTAIAIEKKFNILHIFNMGGKRLGEWQEIAEKQLNIFARANGCKAIQAVMRKGLSRIIKDSEEDGTIYIKFLE